MRLMMELFNKFRHFATTHNATQLLNSTCDEITPSTLIISSDSGSFIMQHNY
jgi:hypothetical protein